MYMSAKNGETYGLLGHNGCGKTTLLDILTGESRPTRGNAWVAGALTTTGRSHIAASVGVCPQNDMVVGDLTVIENLRFFARLRGAPMLGAPLEALVKRCAELIGLSTHLDRPASALSGGQRRRLQVGVAVIGSPQVILADEPSAGLDPANRLGIWKLLGRIRESGETAVVITTHSMAEADALCTRIGIVAGGRMRALGNQVALRARYGLGNSVQMQLPITAVAAEPPHELAARVMDAETAAIHGLTTKLELALKLGIHLKVNHELLDSAAAQRARGGTWDLVAKTWAWEVRVQVLFPPGTDLASVFEAMTSGSIGVQDWAISQSSLEDVFIRVSNQYYQS
ncbi:P-loop containing nucleoside triphosphate hydrolase protein [Blastocladiella britannica]|nr:P-loop containing nucleoside triphosphate hydrolase protein [Blastocladiella britannica]